MGKGRKGCVRERKWGGSVAVGRVGQQLSGGTGYRKVDLRGAGACWGCIITDLLRDCLVEKAAARGEKRGVGHGKGGEGTGKRAGWGTWGK